MDCSDSVAEIVAAIFLSMLPVLTVFIVAQNFVIEAVSRSG